jgi:hypothetical protein
MRKNYIELKCSKFDSLYMYITLIGGIESLILFYINQNGQIGNIFTNFSHGFAHPKLSHLDDVDVSSSWFITNKFERYQRSVSTALCISLLSENHDSSLKAH